MLKTQQNADSLCVGNHGENYRRNIALSLWLQMLKYSSPIRLVYEMKMTDKVNYIVLIDDGQKAIYFLQTKHVDVKDNNVKNINLETLFPILGKRERPSEFDICEILKSYMVMIHFFEENAYSKTFNLITNKHLKVSANDWVNIEEREVHEILQFPGAKIKHLQLNPTKNAIKEICEYVNADIIKLKDAIKNLFCDGKDSPILVNYCTPLIDVLAIGMNNKCTFSVDFNSESKKFSVAKLYNLLQKQQFDMRKEVKVMKNFMQKVSQFKFLPPYVEEDEVVAFFRDFTLSVGQPNDMRPIIDSQVRAWMKKCIQPEIFGKLNKNVLDQVFNDLERYFEEDSKKYLQKNDIETFLLKIQCDMQTVMMNYTDVDLEKHYVNRKIRFEAAAQEPMALEKHDNVRNSDGRLPNKIKKLSLNNEETDDTPKSTTLHHISDTDFVKQLRGSFKDQQHIILVADPGMGKTTFLQFAAFEMQKQYEISVFLVSFCVLVKNLDSIKKVSDLNEVLSILSAVLSNENCDIIRKAPEKRAVDDHSIILVMDGLDEVYPKYSKKVNAMLELLSLKKSIQIVISSRIHFKKSLERKFKVKSLFLEPFSEEDQISYLRKTWNVEKDAELSCFESYSKRLLKTFDSSILSNYCEIAGLPLMMKMLAEIYLDKFKQYCAVSEKDKRQQLDLSEDKLNIVQLYEQFVQKCFHIKLRNQYQNQGDVDDADLDSMIRSYILEHQLLAMKFLDIAMIDDLLKNPIYKAKYDDLRKRCDMESKNSYLVKYVSNNVQFCHRSYCDYFVAKYLCDHISTLKEKDIISIFAKHDAIKKFSMLMLNKNETYFEILNELCNLEWDIASYLCQSRCPRMVSTKEEKFGNFSLFKFNMVFQDSAKRGFNEICNSLRDFYEDFKGRIASHSAVKNEHVKVVKLSLSCKTNFKRRDTAERSPPHTVDISEFVIDNNSDLKKLVKKHWTAVNFTAQNGRLAEVNIMINRVPNTCSRSTSGKAPLHIAAQNGHADVVKFLVEKHSDLDKVDEHKWTALHWAAQNGYLEVVQTLVDRGANSCYPAKLRETPLHIAAFHGHADVAKCLINNNSNPNDKDFYQWTALHLAARNGHEAVVKLLVAKQVDTSSRLIDGKTPLHIAALKGHKGVVELLIENRSDPNEKNKIDWTALHFAARNGNVAVAETLIAKGANIHSRTKFGETPLHIAAQHGHSTVAELLIEKKSNLNEMDIGQWTALHWSAQNGHAAVVNLLMVNRADHNSLSINGKTPLHVAALHGHAGVASMLIKKCSDLNVVDDLRWTALHFATQNGNVEVIKCLVEAGAKVCSQTIDGLFPLHIAAFNGHMEAVEFLIEKNADPNVQDKDQWTALHLAVQNGHVAVAKLLINSRANTNSRTFDGRIPLHIAAQNGHVNCTKLLIEKNCNPNEADESKWTALHHASQNGYVTIVKFLIDKGAKTNSRTKDGKIPLHIVAQNGYAKCAKLLIENNSETNAMDDSQWTALHYAAQNGHAAVVKLLIDKGANIKAQTNDGRTPSEISSQHRVVVALLSKNNKSFINMKRSSTHRATLPLSGMKNMKRSSTHRATLPLSGRKAQSLISRSKMNLKKLFKK